MNDLFYRTFEEKFRGSRSLIRSRLDIYRAFLSPLKRLYADARGLDLGCGRGEWLEVLQEEGIDPLGVDLDDGMLEACRALNLPTVKGDAVAYLASLPSESQDVISAFHMVEHISFDQLQLVVSEALRVLKPGGLLIMETPNPENIAVATRDFYLDPTHQRPIPPALLSFLPEYHGFHRSKILRLQQSASLQQDANPSLMDVLAGVSPDYAVIAQKAAIHAHLAAFDSAFGAEYGLPLHVLTSRYDAARKAEAQQAGEKAQQAGEKAQQAGEKAQQAGEKAQQAGEKAQQAGEKAQQAEEKALQAKEKAQQAEEKALQAAEKALQAEEKALQAAEKALQAAEKARQAEEKAQHGEDASNQYLAQLQEVYASRSWRITKPIRSVKRLITPDKEKKIPQTTNEISSINFRIRHWLRPYVAHGIRHVLLRPRLRNLLGKAIKKIPKLHKRLLRIGINTGVIEIPPEISVNKLSFSATSECSSRGTSKQGRFKGKRVAVLAPSAANGVSGGAERFYSGLAKSLSDKGCEVDLISLTVDESTFEAIQKGYREFSRLNLSEYDLVISTKAPTFAVKHANHVMYLVHTVRAFYDMFDDLFPSPSPILLNQREWIQQTDSAAIQQTNRRFSIGHEVSSRLKKWNSVDAEVLHPPMDISGLYDRGIGDYFFLPGRLHPWKRVDLAIRAIKLSRLPMKLLIAGTGEAEHELHQLAGDDKRIEFLGRVSDERLKTLYAEALAIPFTPLREDYGYITLEAFASGKPVITCCDSGEPTEFVVNGVTGFVCPPDPELICQAFERLWNDRKLAKKLGQAGREKIAGIQWPVVAERLLEAGFGSRTKNMLGAPHTLKVAVLDMQPIMPAVGGGRLRLLGLYHALGDNIQTRYVGTFDWPGEKFRRHSLSATLEEIDVPLSAEHHQAASDAANRAGGRVVIDMLFSQQALLSPDYIAEVEEAIRWADVVVFSHPWVAPLIGTDLLIGKTVIYDSHNVELNLRTQLLGRNRPFECEILAEVERSERLAGDRADLILACSEEDVDGFVDLYGWPRTKMLVVPNGVFANRIKPPTAEEKRASRIQLQVDEGRLVAFFIGSDYAPNIEAAEIIVREISPTLPEVEFVIAGGVCSRLNLGNYSNVRLVGFVEDQQKLRWLHAADLALNPMCSGSGTNIKMFDFMAAGLPIVTTAIGARGITSTNTAGIHIANLCDMEITIRKIIENPATLHSQGKENREIVNNRFSWETTSPKLGSHLRGTWLQMIGTKALETAREKKNLRIAHITTTGIKCGIGEYTQKIIDTYRNNHIENLVINCESATENPSPLPNGILSEVGWYMDNKSWKDSHIKPFVLDRLKLWQPDFVLIQYHPGFYPPDVLLRFVEGCIERQIMVAVVLHRYDPSCSATLRILNELQVSIFSHSETEVQRGLEQGIVFELVPLGVDLKEPVQERTIHGRDWITHPPTIITNGFLRKHKGVRHLIKAMPRIIAEFPGAKLKVQCSLYPSNDSQDELQACLHIINEYKLNDHVLMDTRFLDKSEVIRELSKADLAVLPYEESNEGGSASATDAFAAGLPLIVSTAEIFNSIRGIVSTASHDPDELARAILHLLHSPKKYKIFADASLEYAKRNSWGNIAGFFLPHPKHQG